MSFLLLYIFRMLFELHYDDDAFIFTKSLLFIIPHYSSFLFTVFGCVSFQNMLKDDFRVC